MNFKFSAEVKQIFIDVFNTSSKEIPSNTIHKVLTAKLHESGDLTANVELNSEAVRQAYEKMGLLYKNRPKLNQVFGITFEEEEDNITDTADLTDLRDAFEEVMEEAVEETLFEA